MFEKSTIEVGGDAGIEGEIGALENVEVIHIFLFLEPVERLNVYILCVIPSEESSMSRGISSLRKDLA